MFEFSACNGQVLFAANSVKVLCANSTILLTKITFQFSEKYPLTLLLFLQTFCIEFSLLNLTRLQDQIKFDSNYPCHSLLMGCQ